MNRISVNKLTASAQKNKMSAEAAKEYCDCALGEIKRMIPNPQYFIKLTEEEYQSILTKCK